MANGLNASTDIGGVINSIGEFILGDMSLIGIWLLIVFIGVGISLNIDFTLILIFIIPLIVVCMTFGLIYPAVGGTILIIDAFILGVNFIFKF